jgi:hypothetical protein
MTTSADMPLWQLTLFALGAVTDNYAPKEA